MATVNDCPQQYRPALRTCNKGFQKIIDIVADATIGITGQQKADRIAELNIVMQNAVTNIEKMLVAGVVDIEGEIDAIIAKPL